MTLTHLDPEGRPRMVDVSAKAVTRRRAVEDDAGPVSALLLGREFSYCWTGLGKGSNLRFCRRRALAYRKRSPAEQISNTADAAMRG